MLVLQNMMIKAANLAKNLNIKKAICKKSSIFIPDVQESKADTSSEICAKYKENGNLNKIVHNYSV